MSASNNRSRSLFAERRAQLAAKSAQKPGVDIDPDAIYAVEQCANGAYKQGERQLVPIGFIEALRDAAFALDIDFGGVVAPHFDTLDEYDRCVYTWRSGDSCGWAVLLFDGMRRAMLTLKDVPGIAKLVGTFAYSVCPERGALRLHDVGPYAEVLVEPDGGNVRLRVPEAKTTLVLNNETPERLRVAPAAPSYFDGE